MAEQAMQKTNETAIVVPEAVSLLAIIERQFSVGNGYQLSSTK